MKNLKRLLSLALAGTMLCGMMVMGASAADFGDADKIVNTEAVDTMVALNIINGKPDGNYDPEGLVTRAEMAKMIATAVNGGVAPEFGTKPTPTYTDIKGNWAEQYIEYCYDMKYISGRGNGIFDPAGNVTGVEAAKMVLTALGYDESAYQLKGADWAINTNAIAIRTCKPSLYENLNGVNMNVAITRDTAAQIIWNGVQNHVVEWTPNREVTGTGLNYQYTINPNVTLLNKAYDAHIWVGTFTGNEKFGISGLSKGEIEVAGDLENADRTGSWTPTAAHFAAEYDISNIGEETKVIFKDGKSGRKNIPDRGDTIYGVFNTGATTVYNTTVGGLGDDKKTDNNKIKFDGETYELALNGGKFTFMTNYSKDVTATTIGDFGTKEYTDINTAATAIKTTLKAKKTGDPIKFVTDANGKIVAGYMAHSDLAVVLAKNSEKITLNNNFGSIKIADNKVYDGVAKDDVVVATRLYKNSADDGYTIVEKAEKVSGEVKAYKNAETVTLDGETYKLYGETTLFNSGLGSDAKTAFSGTIGEEFDLYLVNGRVRAAVQTTETANNWSVVLEAKGGSDTSSVFNTLELQVLNAENEKSIIKVSKDTSTSVVPRTDPNKLAAGDIPAKSLITYTVNKSGEAVIKNFVKATPATSLGYNKDTKTFGGVTTSAECVLFVNTGSTIKAYKIRDLGNVAAANSIVAKNTANDRVVAAYSDLGSPVTGASSTRVYGIISADNGTAKVDNAEKKYYTASVNGESYTLYLTNGTLEKGDVVSFEPSSDDVYADVNAAAVDGDNKVTKLATKANSVAQGWVREYSEADGTLSIWVALQAKDSAGNNTTTPANIASYEGTGVSTTYVVNKDTKFYYVDQDNDTSLEAGSITGFDPIKGLSNVVVVYHKEESNGVANYIADVVIFETSSNADIIKDPAGRVNRP